MRAWRVEHLGGLVNLTRRVIGFLVPPGGRIEQLCRPPHPLPPPVEPDLAPADRAVRLAVAAVVVPWALGAGDPAREPLERTAWLRLLERGLETRSLVDEAALLRVRLSLGDLTPERLQVAAHCGSAGARRASGVTQAVVSSAEEWLVGLHRLSPRAALRAALLVARLALPVWSAHRSQDLRPLYALEAAAELLAGDGRPEDLRRAADEGNDAYVEAERGPYRAHAAAGCASAVADYALAAGPDGLEEVLELARDALGTDWDEVRVLAAMEADVLAWALGDYVLDAPAAGP